jgi:hypothetical protein
MPGAAGVVLLEAVKTKLALRPRPATAPVRARHSQALRPQPAGMTPPHPAGVEIRREHD